MKNSILLFMCFQLISSSLYSFEQDHTAAHYQKKLKTHFSLINKSRILQEILTNYTNDKTNRLWSTAAISATIFGAGFLFEEQLFRYFPAAILYAWNLDTKRNHQRDTSQKIKDQGKEIQTLLQNKSLLEPISEDTVHTSQDHESMVTLIAENEQTNIDRFIPGCGIRHRIKKLKDTHPNFSNELHEIWIQVTEECQKRYADLKK